MTSDRVLPFLVLCTISFKCEGSIASDGRFWDLNNETIHGRSLYEWWRAKAGVQQTPNMHAAQQQLIKRQQLLKVKKGFAEVSINTQPPTSQEVTSREGGLQASTARLWIDEAETDESLKQERPTSRTPANNAVSQQSRQRVRYETPEKGDVRDFLAAGNLGYTADGFFEFGVTRLRDLQIHPMYSTDEVLKKVGMVKASHRRRFRDLLAALPEWMEEKQKPLVPQTASRLAICMTGQVRSLEELVQNIRDMIVRPLQQIFDTNAGGIFKGRQNSAVDPDAFVDSSSINWGLEGNGAQSDVAIGRSNVHLFALLVLRDELEGKGFKCHGSSSNGNDRNMAFHTLGHTKALLEMLGAPIQGFAVDDAATRAMEAPGCRAWPGFIQADQIAQCWKLVTQVEEKRGWQYDYAIRIRPDVAYKRSFRIAHWPLFHSQLQHAMNLASGQPSEKKELKLIAGTLKRTSNDIEKNGVLMIDEHAAGRDTRHPGVPPPETTSFDTGIQIANRVEAAMRDIMMGGTGFGSSQNRSGARQYLKRHVKADNFRLKAYAPCKCMTHAGGGKVARRLNRAQDVVWAIPRAGADALFGVRQEYLDRGCQREPWREIPLPRWLKQGCKMHVDGRDHYECMFILRLMRFNIGYDVVYPPDSPTQSLDDGGWKIMRPSWCEKVRRPSSSPAKRGGKTLYRGKVPPKSFGSSTSALMPDWGSNQ